MPLEYKNSGVVSAVDEVKVSIEPPKRHYFEDRGVGDDLAEFNRQRRPHAKRTATREANGATSFSAVAVAVGAAYLLSPQ